MTSRRELGDNSYALENGLFTKSNQDRLYMTIAFLSRACIEPRQAEPELIVAATSSCPPIQRVPFPTSDATRGSLISCFNRYLLPSSCRGSSVHHRRDLLSPTSAYSRRHPLRAAITTGRRLFLHRRLMIMMSLGVLRIL